MRALYAVFRRKINSTEGWEIDRTWDGINVYETHKEAADEASRLTVQMNYNGKEHWRYEAKVVQFVQYCASPRTDEQWAEKRAQYQEDGWG